MLLMTWISFMASFSHTFSNLFFCFIYCNNNGDSLTELTSNLTTTVTFLPVVASVGLNLGIDPMLLILPLLCQQAVHLCYQLLLHQIL